MMGSIFLLPCGKVVQISFSPPEKTKSCGGHKLQYFQSQNSNRVVCITMDIIVNSVLSRCNTDRKYGRFILALCSQSMGEVKQGVNYQPKGLLDN